VLAEAAFVELRRLHDAAVGASPIGGADSQQVQRCARRPRRM
jgi:hypothetical protein